MQIPHHLFRLAPSSLHNYRRNRYRGDGLGISLGHLAPLDQAIATRLYQATRAVVDPPGLPPATQPSAQMAALEALAEPAFVDAVRQLGDATDPLSTSSPIAQALHDVRGGALNALIGLACGLQLGMPLLLPLDTCVRLARDHCKIMRNALPDLDPPHYQQDLLTRFHGVDEFVRTWEEVTLCPADVTVRVRVQSLYQGGIAGCCLENAAIDRVLYNYVNNAVRFAADGQVRLWIFPIEGGVIRWVVSNPITPSQRDWLEATTGMDLRVLFQGGLTQGGEGIGLTSCVQFVAACFGVIPTEAALEAGYLGAKVVGDEYHAWFHWPAYDPASSDAVVAG